MLDCNFFDFDDFDDFDSRPQLGNSLAFCATISNSSYLKSLHVKLAHARNWLSDVDRIYLSRNGGGKRPSRASKRLLTKTVQMIDVIGAPHVVLFEFLSSKGQLHCRLSQGWDSFCRANGVAVQDRLTFETRRDHDLVFVRQTGR